MAKEISKLFVTLGLDDKGFKSQLKQIDKQMSAMGKTMLAAGAAVLAGIGMSVKAWADAGDQIQKMSLRTKWAAESLSELKHVAEISGTELEAFEKGTRRMSQAISDASDGLVTYLRDFEKLGLDAKELKEMSPEEAFWKIAYALGDMTNEIEQANIAQGIFGRTGTQLLPMLAEGADGIAKLREEAHDLGIVFDDQAANQAAELTDTIQRLKSSVKGLTFEIAEQAAPTISSYAKMITNATKSVSRFADEHPALSNVLVNTGLSFGGVATSMGLVILGLPKLIQFATAAKLSFRSFGLAAAGLTTGLTLLGAGISLLIQYKQKFNEQVEAGIAVTKEYTKYLAGERNELYKSMRAWADAEEAHARASGMREEDKKRMYEWAQAVREGADTYEQAEIDAVNATEDAIQKLKDYYGDYEEAIETCQDVAREARDKQLDFIDDVIERVHRQHDEQIALYEDIYQKGINALEKKYQDEIDIIDETEEQRERALRRQEMEERFASINSALLNAKNSKERRSLEEDLADALQDIADQQHRWDIQDKKDALREKIDAVREGTDEEAKQLQEVRDAAIAAENEKLEVLLANLEVSKVNAEQAFQDEMARIKILRDSSIQAYKDRLEAYLETMRKGLVFEQEFKSHFETGTYGMTIEKNTPTLEDLGVSLSDIFEGYQYGGIVPGQVGQPVLAMVHGGEMISPPGRAAINNNFKIYGMVVREEADIYRIARELYRMQQVR